MVFLINIVIAGDTRWLRQLASESIILLFSSPCCLLDQLNISFLMFYRCVTTEHFFLNVLWACDN